MKMKVLGLETLAKAFDKLGSKATQGPVCIACAEGLATTGYKICVVVVLRGLDPGLECDEHQQKNQPLALPATTYKKIAVSPEVVMGGCKTMFL